MSSQARSKSTHNRLSQPLAGQFIGISISESPAPDLAMRGLGRIHLDHAFIELTRHLIMQGAAVAYGGDHRVEGYTQSLFDLVRTYYQQDKPVHERIRNYLAWPIHQSMPVSDRASHVDVANLILVGLPDDLQTDSIVRRMVPNARLPVDPAENRRIWARCLTAMRQKMNDEVDARILLGGRYGGIIEGKLDRFSGKYPGLVEEAYLAIKARKPIFLLGGFGGCTKVIIDAILGRSPAPLTLEFHTQADPIYREMVERFPLRPDSPINYQTLLRDFQQTGVSGLNNGLDELENRRLFDTDDIDEMIALVLKGLTTL